MASMKTQRQRWEHVGFGEATEAVGVGIGEGTETGSLMPTEVAERESSSRSSREGRC